DIDLDQARYVIGRFKAGAALADKVNMAAVDTGGVSVGVGIDRCDGGSCPGARGIEDAAQYTVDFSELGAAQYELEVFLAHESAHVVQQAGGVAQFVAGGASENDAEVTIGRH